MDIDGITQRFSLFSLPREVRDEIYHYLFLRTLYTFTQNHLGIAVFYDDGEINLQWKQRTPPKWLCTSKQIFLEGKEQFYREARCYPFHHWASHSPNTYTYEIPAFTFLNVNLVRRLDYSGKYRVRISPLGNDSPNEPFHITPSAPQHDWLHRNINAAIEPRLKELRMYVETRRAVDIDAMELATFEIGSLTFERVHFIVEEPPSGYTTFSSLEGLFSRYVMLQVQLLAVAKRLTRDNNDSTSEQGHVVKDYIEENQYGDTSFSDWHLNVQRSRTALSSGDIKNWGIWSWTDVRRQQWRDAPRGSDSRRRTTFKRTQDAESGAISWFNEATNETLGPEKEY
jgi:hypothetical protein